MYRQGTLLAAALALLSAAPSAAEEEACELCVMTARPDAVRRSVVAHEVAHLVHFDHSPAFRALLDGLFEGDLEAADQWLRREGRGLYAAFG